MDATFITPPVPERPRPARKIAGDALRRRGGRRALSVLSIVLGLAGLAMFAWPFTTDLWSAQIQNKLKQQFNDPQYANAYRLRQIKIGQGLTRLTIPDLDNLSVLVVEGTTPAALKAGAGHYVGTPLPGEAGNVAIAGHRTTYGRPFNRLDELKAGQVIYLDTPFARYEYRVAPTFDDGHANPFVVKPSDYYVVAPPKDPAAHWLTLTTCHPKGSAAQRLVLRAHLTKTLPPPKQQ